MHTHSLFTLLGERLMLHTNTVTVTTYNTLYEVGLSKMCDGSVGFIFYCCSNTVVSVFPTMPLAPPTPTSHPNSSLRLCPWFLYVCSSMAFLLFSPTIPPPPAPPITVCLFSVSVSLVLFCLFVLLIRFPL